MNEKGKNNKKRWRKWMNERNSEKEYKKNELKTNS